MTDSLTIGELTRSLGITARTLRFWEDRGLLRPRREGQRRLYGPRQRTRAELILRGQRLGFSLAEVKEILTIYDASGGTSEGEARQLTLLLDRIATRRAELEQKRADIEATLGDLEAVADGCRRRLAELAGREKRRAGGT